MGLVAPAEDRTCIVTGASAGIGAEIARDLASRGHGVTLVARREDRLEALAEELASRHGVRAESVPADLNDEEARRSLASQVADRGLTAEVLVNNAGRGTFGPVHDGGSSADEGGSSADVGMLRTNVEALADLCSLFLPGMVERGRGGVLNVASTAAYQPMPGQAAYGASKAFVVSYTHALRAELRGTGVTVTLLCPGPVETEFDRAGGKNEGEAALPLPRFMWVPAADVAQQAVAGLDRGRAVVVPGTPNRVGVTVGRHAPAGLVARVVAARHPALP